MSQPLPFVNGLISAVSLAVNNVNLEYPQEISLTFLPVPRKPRSSMLDRILQNLGRRHHFNVARSASGKVYR